MRLANTEGELDLVIAGYQLGEGERGDGFNCLNVDGTFRHSRGDWSFRGKFCSMGDLAALADWFEAVAAGGTPDVVRVGGFMCHALAFAVSGSRCPPHIDCGAPYNPPAQGVLRVVFGDSTHPPWYNMEWVSMDFALSHLDLRVMAAEVREQLRAHPPR